MGNPRITSSNPGNIFYRVNLPNITKEEITPPPFFLMEKHFRYNVLLNLWLILKKKALLFIPLIFLLVFSTVNNVIAPVSYDDITMDSDYYVTHPQFQSESLDNGKFVYVYLKYDSAPAPDVFECHIYVYSASGTQEAHTNQSIASSNDEPESYVVSAIDADNVLVVILVKDEFNNDLRIRVLEYNTNTYILTNTANGADLASVGAETDGTTSDVIWYSSVAYGIFSWLHAGATETSLNWKYDPATNTLTQDVIDSTPNVVGYIFHYFDTTIIEGSNWVFLIGADPASKTTVKYFKWDLDNWSATDPELLATHPFATDWDHNNRLSLRVLGGDIFWSTTENDYILYWYWTYSQPSTYAHVVIFCHRLRFNATGIDSTNLEAQSRMRDGVNVPNEGSSNEVSHITGYLRDKDSPVIYHSYLYTLPSTYRTAYIEFEITDFDDFASSAIDIFGTSVLEAEDFPNQGRQYFTFKDTDSTFMFSQLSTAVRIYYGMEPLSGNWDITQFYSPADVPIEAFTVYTFYTTLWSGTVRVSTDYTVVLNNATIHAGLSDSQGQFTFLYGATGPGLVTFTVNMYYGGDLVYSEDFSYVFADVDDDETTTPGLFAMGISAMYYFLPAFIICLVAPLFFFFATKEPFVFFSVLVICAYVASIAGIIPSYVMMLTVFITCAYVFLEVNK